MTHVVYKPTNTQQNRFHNHAGDSFREMIDLWESHGLVEVKESPNQHIWFGNVGDILLYDRPTLQWLDPSVEYRIGIFGNPIADQIDINSNRNVPWTFWGRRPKLLEAFHNTHGQKGYDDRTIESVFVGKIENEVQNKYRKAHDWSSCIQVFEMPYGKPGEYKYTQEQYLELLSKSRFGLSVRGYGPKCHREVELMGMGVVPLVTDDVDVLSYHDPPIEGTHFVRVSEPNDVHKVISGISQETWESMSRACLAWYDKHVSVKGSFETTCEIVSQNERFRKPTSVCTICTNTCMHDLRVFLQSFELHEPNMPIVLLCDNDVAREVKSRYHNKPNIIVHQCLDRYSGMNRKQMEAQGIWSNFMNLKSDAIDKALEKYEDTLMLDSDIVLMHNLPIIDTSKEIGLSPHFIVKTNVDKYGYYNGGYVYVRSKAFTNWWRDAIPSSKFYDQGCLEQAPERFTHFEFDIQDNFGWWRLLECDNPNERARKFSTNKTRVLYDSKPLRSIHTHLTNDNFPLTVKFNHFIKMFANKLPFAYPYLNTEEPVKDILTVLVQYYNDPNPERQAEIDYCFRYNLENPFVKRVVHFNEPGTKVPDWMSNHPKFVSVPSKDRLTYKQAFEYASKTLKDGSFVTVMNADIFLTKESPWNEMCAHLKTDRNVVYALSRHDFDGNRLYKDPALQKMAYANAQDAWFFMTPIKIADCDFRVGTMGCDNAIAERFKRSGYLPINSPNKFKIGHYDICRGKNGSNYMQDKYKKLNKDVFSPEKDGQYLLPDIDAVQSVDSLLHSLNASREYKYSLICDIMSKFIKINNA